MIKDLRQNFVYYGKPILGDDYINKNGPAPKQFPFPEDGICPKCDERVYRDFTETYFHCYKCGTELYKWRTSTSPVEQKIENGIGKYERPERVVPCWTCGKEVTTRSNSQKVYCPEHKKQARYDAQKKCKAKRKERRREGLR